MIFIVKLDIGLFSIIPTFGSLTLKNTNLTCDSVNGKHHKNTSIFKTDFIESTFIFKTYFFSVFFFCSSAFHNIFVHFKRKSSRSPSMIIDSPRPSPCPKYVNTKYISSYSTTNHFWNFLYRLCLHQSYLHAFSP